MSDQDVAARVAAIEQLLGDPMARLRTPQYDQFTMVLMERQAANRRRAIARAEAERVRREAQEEKERPARERREKALAKLDEQIAEHRAAIVRLEAEKRCVPPIRPPAPASPPNDGTRCVMGHKLKESERAHYERKGGTLGREDSGMVVYVPAKCGQCHREAEMAARARVTADHKKMLEGMRAAWGLR